MTEIILKLILLSICSYLVGSLPTGVIISKRFFGFDIRTKGSGNMGSTNISRVLGTKWGVIVQAIDILKGIVAVTIFGILIGGYWGMCEADSFLNLPILEMIIGLSAIAGHIWSCFVKFKGGKGMNTALGVLIAVFPIEVGIAMTIFTLTVGLTGYVSLSSIFAAFTLPLALLIRYNLFQVDVKGYLTLIYILIGFVLLVIYTHMVNIIRLFKGTESKMEKMQFLRRKKTK